MISIFEKEARRSSFGRISECLANDLRTNPFMSSSRIAPVRARKNALTICRTLIGQLSLERAHGEALTPAVLIVLMTTSLLSFLGDGQLIRTRTQIGRG